MAPRIIDDSTCPPCGHELPERPEDRPRVCPNCAGSLQVRYLKKGCLTSKPIVLALGCGLAWGLAKALAPFSV